MVTKHSGQVMTVLGPVDPESLEFTLPHEHMFIELWDLAARFDYPVLLDDDELIAEELTTAKAAGIRSVVELTVPDIGRAPARLRSLSQQTGLHVVMGSGWYREPYYRDRAWIERASVSELAERLISEIDGGAAGTDIRPGVIGEIGVHRSWVTPIEERVHRAAGRAQLASGLPLITHSPMSSVGLAQLEILEAEGVDPSRVAIGHADSYPHLQYHLEVLERGAWLMYDNIGGGSDRMEQRRVDLVRELIERGHVQRLLLSQDVCTNEQLRFNGGAGCAGVPTVFLPRLRSAGVTGQAIEALTRTNPQRFLTIR
jgi:phosphotriesterase-related protein